MMHYDIVIIGAGCSGLSLAYEIVKQQKLDQKIIIILIYTFYFTI